MLRRFVPILLLGYACLLPGAEPTLPVPANLTAEQIPRHSREPDGGPGSLHRISHRRADRLASHAARDAHLHALRTIAADPSRHAPGGARTQLTFYADRVQGSRYRPDGSSFLFSKDIGGGEWFQIYNYDTRTGHATLLTDGKSRNMGGLWSRDGAHFAYASTRRNGRDMDIYVGVPEHPEEARRVVEADSGGWEAEDFSPDGKSLAVIRAVSAYEAALLLVDTASDRQTTLTPRQPGVSYRHARFAPDGKTVYLHHEPGFRLRATCRAGYRHAPPHSSAARLEVGRDLVRSDARRPAHRLHRERKWLGHAARDGYGDAQRAGPAEASLRQYRRCALARKRTRPGLHDYVGAHAVGRLFDRYRSRQTGTLDVQRNRGTRRLAVLRAGADSSGNLSMA